MRQAPGEHLSEAQLCALKAAALLSQAVPHKSSSQMLCASCKDCFKALTLEDHQVHEAYQVADVKGFFTVYAVTRTYAYSVC